MWRWIGGVAFLTSLATAQPSVEWATYLGATAQDELRATALGPDGSIVVVGWTLGVNFPVRNAWQGANAGGEDAVIAKFDPSGSLLWSTYFGGSGNERAVAVAVDGEGNIYVVGTTTSPDLPVAGAFQSSKAAGSDAFIAKFSAAGQRLWATYYGGNGDEVATGVVVDAQGLVDITGYTTSTNFPVTANAVQTSLAGYADAFLLQMRPDGIRVWATYFGGTAPDYAFGIAVDARRTIYICGETSSPNFPLRNPFQRSLAGGTDAFVASFSAFGVLNWSSYYGGVDNDRAYSVAVTPDRRVTVVGVTASGDLRVTPVWQVQHAGGGTDGFVLQLSSAGEFLWATFLGGGEPDVALSCAADPVGSLYVAGRTASGDFSVQGGGGGRGGGDDLFIVKLHRSGMPQWGLLYGGTGAEQAYGIALDSSGNIVAVGSSGSTDFPTTSNAWQTNLAGLNDGVVLRLQGYVLSIELQSLPDTVLCTGDSLWLRWRVMGGEFRVENFFVAELSDAGGSFQAAVRLDSIQARRDTALRVFIPVRPLGGRYRLRIAATAPLAYSNDNGTFLSALQRPQEPQVALDGDTVFCQGRRAVLYIVQPQPGVFYRWRRDSLVVSEHDTIYAAMESGYYTVEAYNACGRVEARRGFRLTVLPLPRRPLITPSGTVRLCEGDTLELRITGEPGVQYLWFRNDTALVGASDTVLRVWRGGTYEVEARNTCGSVRSQNRVVVRLVPRPPKPVIGRRGDTLISSALTGNQWLDEQKQPIPGATGREFVPPRDGTYYVQVTVDSCSSVSDPYVFVRSGIGEQAGAGFSWHIEPNPTSGSAYIVGEGVGRVLVRVLDILGRSLWQQEVLLEGPFRLPLPSQRWAAGTYSVQLLRQGSFTQRYLVVW